MYCEYWNLHKAPFDNVPDPSMYADCHTSMGNVISETIFAIKEGNEAFAVIIGAAGLGKTLSLRIIIDSLDSDHYKVVLITNPSISFTQLLREIIGQVTGKHCEENRKDNLLETFIQLLFESSDSGHKIVIFIDEANALSPANLEHLRLLTNAQDDQRNLFTLVLAGQVQLAHRLEHPKRDNLFQRIGTYGRLDRIPSEEAVEAYISKRLELAGTNIKIFNDECIPEIWEYSEHGVPRLINKICKLCLKSGEINNLDYISAETVIQVADRFKNLSNTAVQRRKPRIRTDRKNIEDELSWEEAFPMVISDEVIAKPVTESVSLHFDMNEQSETPVMEADRSMTEPLHADEIRNALKAELEKECDEDCKVEMTIPFVTELQVADLPLPLVVSAPDTRAFIDAVDAQTEASFAPVVEAQQEQESITDEKPHVSAVEGLDEIVIGEYIIQLNIPADILRQVKTFNRDSANKSAGFWAAQIIKKNPHLTRSPLADPVYIWNEIKDSILKKIAF